MLKYILLLLICLCNLEAKSGAMNQTWIVKQEFYDLVSLHMKGAKIYFKIDENNYKDFLNAIRYYDLKHEGESQMSSFPLRLRCLYASQGRLSTVEAMSYEFPLDNPEEYRFIPEWAEVRDEVLNQMVVGEEFSADILEFLFIYKYPNLKLNQVREDARLLLELCLFG
jgi:hypothetical protein